ncbi:MAG: alpha/beta fold hydrolase [Bacteroidales bacterium]
MKTLLKYSLYFLVIIIIVLIALAITFRVKSPGTPDPIIDSNGKEISGSISTIEKIVLGGQEQYLIIRGKDKTKPVMLFLHGGPGSPEFAFMKSTNQAIENDFVMVYWEQRGAGKSYSKNIPAESINLEQFISDTRELSKYLAKQFNKEKIYLMGHSWGSFLGILTANQYPELYHAYFGIGQVCYQYKGEYISYEWVKKQALNQNNKKALQALNKISFPDSLASIDKWQDFLMVERNYISQFGGGVTREMTGMWPMVKMILNINEYTFKEKMTYMPASLFSLKYLWPEVINKNLNIEIDSMQIPVYIFQGKFDYQTPYSVAKEFFDQLKAPEKEFFTFENSAHSPLMEEVEKFNSIVIEKTARK